MLDRKLMNAVKLQNKIALQDLTISLTTVIETYVVELLNYFFYIDKIIIQKIFMQKILIFHLNFCSQKWN